MLCSRIIFSSQFCQHIPKTFSRVQSTYSHAKQREFLSGISGGSVDLSKDDASGIATVVLNFPERKNALTGKMMVDFESIVNDLEMWKNGRGVVLHGAGRSFCSGGDLKLTRSIMDPSKGSDLCRFMQDVLSRFFQLPLISMAFVEGKALGGGAELTTACDFRAFAKTASFGFVQARLGVSPGWGGGGRLVELVGRTKALRLLASGTVLNSQDAHSVGFADYVVEDGKSGLDEVLTILGHLTSAASPFVQQAAKRVVINALVNNSNLTDKLEGERQIFESVWGGPAHIRALSSSIKF